MAEVMVARCGIQWACNMGFTNIELKVDALNLAKAIATRTFDRFPLDLMMKDICMLSDCLVLSRLMFSMLNMHTIM